MFSPEDMVSKTCSTGQIGDEILLKVVNDHHT